MAKGKKAKKYEVSKPTLGYMTADRKDHSHLIWGALHYAQYEMTEASLKKATVEYAKSQKLDHRLLSVVNDKELAFLGKYAYIINGGGELPENVQAGFARALDEAFARAKGIKKARKAAAKNTKTDDGAPVLTVQDRMRMQAEEVGAVFDGWIDDLLRGKTTVVPKNSSPAKEMQKADFKAGQARWIIKFYEPELAEIREVISGKDADVKEGYSNIKKAVAKRIEKLLEEIITAANVIAKVAKAQRKTRKKKAPSTSRMVAKLKYLERHNELGIASVNPADIVGAKELWVYNVKYRKLGCYTAFDAAGLGVKGASIVGYSEDLSREKTLRKPKEQLKDFMGSGKVKLRKFLDNIKAVDTKLKGRINNNIVLLKVFK